MLVRVRTQVGTWRVADLTPETTIGELRARIAEEHVTDVSEASLYAEPTAAARQDESQALPDTASLASLKITHGTMLHMRLPDEATAAAAAASGAGAGEAKGGGVAGGGLRRKVLEDGTIVAEGRDEGEDGRGFRPGMMALSSIKKHWTLSDYLALDSQFEFRIKRQEETFCVGAVLDHQSVDSFQRYMRQFDFRRCRIAVLYGKFTEENKAVVECVYEPPQENFEDYFELMPEDPWADRVEQIAALLELRRVGIMLAHPPREEGFWMSGHEVITAAEFQLEAAEGVNDSPFVTVTATLNAEGEVSVQAFQMSKQCMEMAAEEALEVAPENLGCCKINETFTAIMEGAKAEEVETAFFLCEVPIERHESSTFVARFPFANREGEAQTRQALAAQLSKEGQEGWTFTDLIADFQLLLFLCELLDLQSDMPRVCQAVLNRETPLDDGYRLLIRSLADLES